VSLVFCVEMMAGDDYSAKDITVLEGLDAVRKRPGMYIGSTDKYGLHHLVYEVVDNSVDEHMAGAATTINVSLNKDGSVVVEDDGRGMPVDEHPIYKKSAMEIIVTKLHAGGKFDNKAYAVSGGLHGVGISVVSALSKFMRVEVTKDGKVYAQEYVAGKPKKDVEVVGKADVGKHGTKVIFIPDGAIFSTIDFDYKTLATRFRETCFLNAGLKIVFSDFREGEKASSFCYNGGLVEFVDWLNKTRKPIHSKPIYFKKNEGKTVVEVAIQYSDSYNENIQGFVNTINTIEGGTHVAGLKTALTRAINDYGAKKGIFKGGQKLSGEDVREGITAVISLKMSEPQFEGQTKTKLGNGEIKGIVDSMASLALGDFLEENPAVAKVILAKASSALKAREAAKKAKELVRRKNALSVGSGLPGKLADCSSKKRETTELYVVEGDSAGGTAKGGRDRETQAILPLRGKVLNVEKSNPVKALGSEQISNLITAIGTGVGDSFDISKLRYNKIIIMTDADVDGQHIKALLLTLFYRYVPQLIEGGHIFVAVAPFYKIKKGSKEYYVYSGDELKKKVAEIGKGEVSRFKGLGEMNDEQLWSTTMNPKTRRLKQVSVEDAVEADETFSLLMGDAVAPRREFIEQNADKAEVDL